MSGAVSVDQLLDLSWIRQELVRLEDSIIFALIERSDFKQNLATYEKGFFETYKRDHGEQSVVVDDAGGIKGGSSITKEDLSQLSFLEYFLRETEKVHAKLRRYTSPEEFPFFPDDLPEPIIRPLEYTKVLKDNYVNYNDQLLSQYIEKIVPAICKEGDDKNYGSSAILDINVLQLMSRRIHLGKFVAESKFMDPNLQDKYVDLIKSKDVEGVMELLTNRQVELKILERLRHKASVFGQEIDIEEIEVEQEDELSEKELTKKELTTSEGSTQSSTSPERKRRRSVRTVVKSTKIDRNKVAEIYAKIIITLTKDIEVDYLMKRLN